VNGSVAARIGGDTSILLIGFGASLALQVVSADAHAIAGNRLFPGTLTFDDPAVLDEPDLPFVSTERVPQPLGGIGRDTTIDTSITRLLWPDFAITIDSAQEPALGQLNDAIVAGTIPVGLEFGRHGVEGRREVVTHGGNRADDSHGNQRGNEPIFDGGRATFIGKQRGKQPHHPALRL
jgi:hypothetical protein